MIASPPPVPLDDGASAADPGPHLPGQAFIDGIVTGSFDAVEGCWRR